MVLTRSQYENMSKEELIQELTNINSSFVNDTNAKLSDLSDRFNQGIPIPVPYSSKISS